MPKLRSRDRRSLIQALRAGVVPRSGLQHIQVGRASELSALVDDINHVADGGSTIRFIIGEYGSGKTFFLNLIRLTALEQGLVTVQADLTPDRRLQSTGGHARALYSEFIKNLATRTKPDGGALTSIVERFISRTVPTGEDGSAAIRAALQPLQDYVSGHDFAAVISTYYAAYTSGDEAVKSAAIRWLRGEYPNKTAAKRDLPVTTIIDDDNWYDYLKLLSQFVRLAGYNGIMVLADELVNLYKLNHKVSRTRNYEQILAILNDSLQGLASHIGFIFGGTPDFLQDPYRGLYSYEALQTRLAENSFATNGLVDLSGPVIRLQNLSPEDVFILLGNIRRVFSESDELIVPDAALKSFMFHCQKTIGDAYFRTPRSTVRAFSDLLAVLKQNPDAVWSDLIENVGIGVESNPDLAPLEQPDGTNSQGNADDELTAFTL
ncbi:ATP-binding protein [Neolewinella antarctica]|uniref:ATP-binding protein n=1 Tax=Neolewinella antarctica TaxID=442734 RepID=UPI001439A7E1